MAFSYGDYNDELDHTLKAEEKNTNSLFLFANNNTGTAENLGYYRLYDMKIEGDSQGVTEGIDYVDCLISDGASYIDTGIIPTLDMTFYGDYTLTAPNNVAFGSSESIRSYGIYQSSNRVCYGGNTNITGYSLSSYGNRYQNTLTPTGYILTDVTLGQTVSGNYTHTPSGTYTYTMRLFGEPRGVDGLMCYAKCKIYEFKIYNAENNLIQHLRPCLDTSKVPCMYDEVTKRYFYNQGTGTFGYKKKLRDFQPVLDKNNVPCLMDKINKKYYYAKNGKIFNCREQIGYRGVSYLQGDYNSYIDTGLRANEMHGYTIEIQYKRVTDYSRGNQLVFGSSSGGFDSSEVNCHLRYNYYGYPQGLSYSDEVNNALYNPNVDTIINATFAINTPSSTSSFYLFAGNNNDSPIGACDATIYYWKIYDTNNNLVQHLVPILDSNNVPCMYDKVSQQFFYNQGTGEFSYGIEELECPPANYAEYMDNNSSVFKLDVSRNPGELIGVKYKFMFTDKTPDTVSTSILSTTNGREGVSGWIYFVPSIGGTNFETRMGFGDSNHVFTSTIPFERNKEYEIEFDATDSKFRVNGVEMADTNTNPSASSRGYDLYLFTNTTNYAISDMRLYYVDIYKNHELVGSYRPCLDEDGNICLYNSVNKKYIYKDNSKTPTIENPRYTPITYIESNGTQYIDTGVVPTDNTDISMVCRACNSNIFALDYYYDSVSTHYYTPKFACNELNNTLINNSTHSITVDYYDENGSWKWQDELGSGSTTDISMHRYITIRFVGENVVNYINDYTFILGNELSSNPQSNDIRIILQDYTVYGNIMNNLTINKLYKYQDINTIIKPNLTASEGATLTLGTTNLGYLSEEEIEQATNDGWTLE